MSSDYYSLEKTSEILGMNTAEVNRLRDRGELRAFRDGANWKFRKADVDDYLVKAIKARRRNEDDELLSDEEDDDAEMPTLLADSAAFDMMMEDGLAESGLSLGDTLLDKQPAPNSATVPAPPAPIQDDDDGLSLVGDDLLLAPDSLSLASDDLVLSEDDPVAPFPSFQELPSSPADLSAGGSTLDLADDLAGNVTDDADDLVLSGSGSTADELNLASDSGLSLLEADDDIVLETVEKGGSDAILELDDDDDILSLVDENTPTILAASEDDFQLVPDASIESDDSESASQVIALEEDNIFGEIAADDAPAAAVAVPTGAPDYGTLGSGDFGAGAFGPTPGAVPAYDPAAAPGYGTAPYPGAAAFPASSGPAEPTYGPLWITLSISTCAFLVLAGLMIHDLLLNMWSWRSGHSAVSDLMGMFIDMLGLK